MKELLIACLPNPKAWTGWNEQGIRLHQDEATLETGELNL